MLETKEDEGGVSVRCITLDDYEILSFTVPDNQFRVIGEIIDKDIPAKWRSAFFIEDCLFPSQALKIARQEYTETNKLYHERRGAEMTFYVIDYLGRVVYSSKEEEVRG